MSRRAVAKIVQAFDRLHQRNEKISKALRGEGITSVGLDSSTEDAAASSEPIPSLDEGVKALNAELQSQNKSLSAQNLELHKNHHTMSLKVHLFFEIFWILKFFSKFEKFENFFSKIL